MEGQSIAGSMCAAGRGGRREHRPSAWRTIDTRGRCRHEGVRCGQVSDTQTSGEALPRERELALPTHVLQRTGCRTELATPSVSVGRRTRNNAHGRPTSSTAGSIVSALRLRPGRAAGTAGATGGAGTGLGAYTLSVGALRCDARRRPQYDGSSGNHTGRGSPLTPTQTRTRTGPIVCGALGSGVSRRAPNRLLPKARRRRPPPPAGGRTGQDLVQVPRQHRKDEKIEH